MTDWKFIDKIGLEIEGGWDKNREDLVPDAGIRMDDFRKSACCGELVTPKEKLFKDFETIEKYLVTNWPTETQTMCGFHQHLSFKDIAFYVALMSPKFRKYYLECMKKFGEAYPINNEYFWERLENKNKFCKDIFNPDEQIFLKKKINNDPGRYTQIHYAYGLHKTVEFRLLPTFITVECAIAGVKAEIECVEKYLNENPPKPFSLDREEIIVEELHLEEELDLNLGGKLNSKTFDRIKPFNIFITKGMVPECKYGIQEFYKNGKKVSTKETPDKTKKKNTVDYLKPVYDMDDKPTEKSPFVVSGVSGEYKQIKSAPKVVDWNDKVANYKTYEDA